MSYRYLKEKYGVISGSGAQAQNGNDARWNSEEIFAPLCAFFNYKTATPTFRLDLRGFAPALFILNVSCFHSVSCSEIFSLKSVWFQCRYLILTCRYHILSKIFKTSLLCLIAGLDQGFFKNNNNRTL
jgi:hypothetical protein